MNILAIETATESCSVALQCGDDVQHRFTHQPQQQAKLVLPMVDELMAEADLRPAQLDAVAFGRGPGSFTGLRIAAAVTQAIAFAHDLPVAAVSTLAILAQTAYRTQTVSSVLAAIDARMQEVYWGVYQLNDDGLMSLHGEEQVVAPSAVTINGLGDVAWLGVGSGWRAYSEKLCQRLNTVQVTVLEDCWPHAQDMLCFAQEYIGGGKTIAAEKVEPVYIRNKVAKSLAERGK